MYTENLLEKAERIESLLDDDISKKIFRYRLTANLTNDVRYIHEMLSKLGVFSFDKAYQMYRRVDEAYHIYPQLDVLSFIQSRSITDKKPIIMFGAGSDAEIYYSLLKSAGVEIHTVIDNYYEHDTFHGIKVLRPYECTDITDAIVVLSSRKYADAMYWETIARGVPKDQIFVPGVNGMYVISMEEYFDRQIWEGREHEIFVDAGAYNLQTAIDFTKFAKSYDMIYAFEPDKINYNMCVEMQKEANIDNLSIINAGLWDKDDMLRFTRSGDNGTATSVTKDGVDELEVRSLDSFLSGRPCTFIKMDIEGSELKAIYGAQETIKKWRPRLAICLYHNPMDIIEIPLLINQLVPEYKLKIRHYSTWFFDTVLYAEA